MVCVSALAKQSAPRTTLAECGSWIQLTATPFEDYHFVEWNDHNTDSVRLIQVSEDARYIAFFAANCEEYANWPVVALYDWLLMINVREINKMGYYFSPANVSWYRVVGEPDDMHNTFPQDDQFVSSGFYLTLDKNLKGSGDYYAVVDVADAQGMLCDGLMRSVIIQYSGSSAPQKVALLPNITPANEQIRLIGLDPNVETQVRVFSSTGRLVEQFSTTGVDTYFLQAASVAGCYQVQVQSQEGCYTLRYIVKSNK